MHNVSEIIEAAIFHRVRVSNPESRIANIRTKYFWEILSDHRSGANDERGEMQYYVSEWVDA